MSETSWNPWKATAIGMALVATTALATGLVVANWYGPEGEKKTAANDKAAATDRHAATAAPAKPPSARPAASHTTQVAQATTTPTQAAIEACNQYAAKEAGSRDKTVDTLKDAGIGALVGAAVGAAGGAIADGGKGAGKGAAIGGVLGAGGGTLYGLNENKKHDEQYRTAYGGCMRSRGYAG
jgi:hypothetical protein